MRWAIKVVWADGHEDYLREGAAPGGPVAVFTSKRRALEQADMLEFGLDDYQSCNVVRAPNSRT